MSGNTKDRAKEAAEILEKLRKAEMKMVKARFICNEDEGGSVTFSAKKWKEEGTGNYEMHDGQVYEIPRYVADRLNNHCIEPKHSHILDAEGNPIVHRGKGRQRFSLQPLDFG